MTQKELIEIGEEFLKNNDQYKFIPKCGFVAVKLLSHTQTGEQPDLIGWDNWISVVFRIITDFSDFEHDIKKRYRLVPETGMGQIRYYLCPENLINEKEVPKWWGLLYCNEEGKITVVKKARAQRYNLKSERTLLIKLYRNQKLKNGHK